MDTKGNSKGNTETNAVANQKVSVLIIGQNAAHTLDRCLTSLKAFDEVVYVDGGSTDNSVKIASSYENVVVFENPWPGFIAQRNYSLEKANHNWCFMIDADEEVCPETVEEIYRILNHNPQKLMYKIVRTEFYLGMALESGYGKSDYQERLFDKRHVKYFGGVHHGHLIDGVPSDQASDKVGSLDPKFRINHDDTYGLNEWIKKLPRFATIVAEEKIKAGKTSGKLEVFVGFFYTFFQILFKSLSLGKVGFVIAIQTALYKCLVKLIIYERRHIGFDHQQKEGKYLG